jgi:hypothetical protein
MTKRNVTLRICAFRSFGKGLSNSPTFSRNDDIQVNPVTGLSLPPQGKTKESIL